MSEPFGSLGLLEHCWTRLEGINDRNILDAFSLNVLSTGQVLSQVPQPYERTSGPCSSSRRRVADTFLHTGMHLSRQVTQPGVVF